MTYIEQRQAQRGILEEIRDLVANAEVPSPLRPVIQKFGVKRQKAGPLDPATQRDIGVNREHQEYSHNAGFSGSTSRQLHHVAQKAQWTSFH